MRYNKTVKMRMILRFVSFGNKNINFFFSAGETDERNILQSMDRRQRWLRMRNKSQD